MPDLSSKKSYVGQIGLERLHWRVENKDLKSQISVEHDFKLLQRVRICPVVNGL